jgi:hypothetical protein
LRDHVRKSCQGAEAVADATTSVPKASSWPDLFRPAMWQCVDAAG